MPFGRARVTVTVRISVRLRVRITVRITVHCLQNAKCFVLVAV